MRLVYISGPYRAPTIWGMKQNIRRAEEYAIKWWSLGYAVICPHSNTNFFDGACKDSVWLEGDLEILSRCDICVMIPGWQTSEGAKKERDFAGEKGLEIVYE